MVMQGYAQMVHLVWAGWSKNLQHSSDSRRNLTFTSRICYLIKMFITGGKQMKKWLYAGISTVLLSTALGAGMQAQAHADTMSANASVPLVQALNQNPDNLTPGMGGLAVDNGPVSLMNAPLIYLNLHDQWTGELATSWSSSSDGLQYTFHMNPTAKWSNGQPITANDVVYTWHYYTNPKLQFAYVTGWNYVKDVTAINAHTVQFTLTKPYAPFLSTVASADIVPAAVFSKLSVSQLNHGYYDSHPISSGPYILKQWISDQELLFVPNPYWFGPKVHIKQIIYEIIPNSQTAFNELVTQKLTMGGVPSEDLSQVGSLTPNFNIIDPLSATYNQITPIENGFLKDIRVRQALDFATPKAEIVKYILHGQGIVAHGDQVPGGYFYDPNVPTRQYSPATAEAILKQDGFKPGPGGFLYKDGKELQAPIWTGSTSHTDMNIAQVVSASWEKIGVYAPVHTADWSFVFGAKGPQFNGQPECLLFSWGQGVFPDDTIDFNSQYIVTSVTSPGENVERYSNPYMDRLTEEGTSLTSRTARRQVYWAIQRLEQETLPILFLYWQKSDIAVSKHLHGYQQTVFNSTPVWDWWID